jgi:hypothetical protein
MPRMWYLAWMLEAGLALSGAIDRVAQASRGTPAPGAAP